MKGQLLELSKPLISKLPGIKELLVNGGMKKERKSAF